MRSKTIYNIAAGMLAVALAGCAQNEEIPGGRLSDEAVRFTAAIDAVTRTTNGGNSWATGDAVGISMLEPGTNTAIAANRHYEVTDPATGALAPEGGDMYYPMEGRVDFAAYYPYDAQADGTLAIDLTDQSDPAALDVLWARSGGASKSTAAVNLAFGHVLSRVTFDVTLGDGLTALTDDDITATSFSGMPASATLGLADGTLTPGAADDIPALKAGATTFSALIVPQTGGEGRRADFVVDGETYTWEIPDDVDFAAGDHYVYPVTVQKTGVTVGAPAIAAWDQNEHGTTEPQIIIAEGMAGPLSWILLGDGTLTISGEGAIPDYVYGAAPWFGYADNIKTAIFGSGVTRIGHHAVEGCKNLTSVTIPQSVKSIGGYAFESCYNLASVTFPDGLTSIEMFAFATCSNLTSITIPGGVKSIGAGAFRDCGNLASVTIREGVESIEITAFSECINLTDVTIPGSMKSIGEEAFNRCVKLTEITIPGGVKSIGAGAFRGCGNLVSVTIREGVESIEAGAFSECINLTDVTIPGSMKSIGEEAFGSCHNLTSVTVLAIEPPILARRNFAESFYDTLYVPAGSLTAYQNSDWADAFDNIVEMAIGSGTAGPLSWVVDLDGTLMISGEGDMPDYNSNDNRAPWRKHALLIKKAVIGSGVEGIGLSAFLDCTALETFDVSPDNQHLVSVDGVVFSSDMTLLEVCPATKSGSYTIPLSVESIEYCAFADCTELSLVIDEAHEKYALGPVGELMSKDKTQLHWVPESITGEYLVPKGTEIMAYGATYGFRGTEIFIPESVTKIENYNFAYCSALTDITLMGNTPPQLPEEHLERFWGTDKGNVTLHVPAGKKSAYEYAGYAGFKEVKEDATWPDPTSRGIQGQ